MSVGKYIWITAALFSTIATCGAQEKARTLTCEGVRIEPAAQNPTAIKLTLELGPRKSIAVSGAGIASGSRLVSDNSIQLRFSNKDFTGEYFHYTGDLFLVYKSKHLAKLTCKDA